MTPPHTRTVWEVAADLMAARYRRALTSWLDALTERGYGAGLSSEQDARNRALVMADAVVRVADHNPDHQFTMAPGLRVARRLLADAGQAAQPAPTPDPMDATDPMDTRGPR